MRTSVVQDSNAWWSELSHGGMLLSPAVLKEFLPEGPAGIDPNSDSYQRLRDAYASFASWSASEISDREYEGLYRWIDAVFERFLDYPSMCWQKETMVSDRFKWQTVTGEPLRPNRVLLDKGFEEYHRFLIKIDPRKGHLGMGKGRVEYSKFLTLLRGTKVPFGVFTNGQQFRLVYAGLDYDCWVEWDASQWFEKESGLMQLAGFVALCGKNATYKTDTDPFPLSTAVLSSRTRQGELSQVLGEQVRSAVELFLSSFDYAARTYPDMMQPLRVDPKTKESLPDADVLHALYLAAIRVMMRMVVVLFAESRELLPKSMETYHESYGIEGLFASLEEAARHDGEESLQEMADAWPRLLGLFHLTHQGCSIADIPIFRYNGELFKKGDPSSPDLVLRALAIFEDARWSLDDCVVWKILRLLKIGKVRARRGRSSTWVSGPVDFSDLSTEYIGMMYEGLLDYELKQVTDEQAAIVFLNLGQQPALPLSLLERFSDVELKNLLDKLGKEKTTQVLSDTENEEASEEPSEEELKESESAEETQGSDEVVVDESDAVMKRVLAWAEHAVEDAKLVRMPRGKTDDQYAYKQQRLQVARTLIGNVFGPGELYLIRSSGTRKGTGTFYTRPQLAVPTVHRTLEPLVYDRKEGNGELIPKPPETILSIKVVDPAMGSGSFLVAALRYLTDALYESLVYHKKIREQSGGSCVVTLPFGEPSTGNILEELLPVHPGDERFEMLLKPRLKRHVVERCIYGVDINSLAVELARLSLWIETMDRELPFEFLAHKLKIGNSLVGTWFDRFQEYPVMAWMREGGDKDHNGVHYEKGRWTKAIKETLEKRVKPELVRHLQQTVPLEYEFASEMKVTTLHEKAVKLFEELHRFPLFGEGIQQREEFYRTRIRDDPELSKLKDAFDLWCAIWFWPGDWLDENAPTPDRFYHPNSNILERVKDITEEQRFFHWELEFPDVFITGKGGFDAVVGNPPWEISKPSSKEFFTKYDPIYRTYGKQEALSLQRELFVKNIVVEHEWQNYCSYFKSMSNWTKNVGFPFGDPIDDNLGGSVIVLSKGKGNDVLYQNWRNKRKSREGYADKEHPFRHQGSADINTYKMFLEHAYALCCNKGRIGMIAPSGIYTDKGSTELRILFLDNCRWEWLFGFENRKGIFAIHRSFKFCSTVIEKGGRTESIKTAFMHHDLSDWENPFNKVIAYSREQVERFSPTIRALLEIRTKRDLKILEKIYRNSVLLNNKGPEGWGIQYATEFHMTNDSYLFPPRAWWEEKGYRPDLYSRWLPPLGEKPILDYKGKIIGSPGDMALPLYEGRMIDQFDFSAKGWVSGKGRSAVWRDIPWGEKKIEPQYLISNSIFYNTKNEEITSKYFTGAKVGFMAIGSATNIRAMYCCALFNSPCGNAVPVLQPRFGIKGALALSIVLNSFTFDYVFKCKLGGLNLNYFVIEDTPLLVYKKINQHCILLAASLSWPSIELAVPWLLLRYTEIKNPLGNWRSLWAVTSHERLRLRCILDAIVAELYGLDFEDFAWILRNDSSDPKGFWRIDRHKPQEIRQTTLSLVAFKELKRMIVEKDGNSEKGIIAFCEQNNGAGWMIPEKINFIQRDEGLLEFDTSDSITYEVRSKLDNRFLSWQQDNTPEESWKECELHARNILGDEGYKKFQEEINNQKHVKDDTTYLSLNGGGGSEQSNKQKSLLRWNK
jgi:hypothetical protein